MILALFALAASVHSDFEAGSIGKTEWLSASHLRAGVIGEVDQNGRNRQPSWFYFRVDGVAAGQEVTIDLANFDGEYNFRKDNGSGHRTMKPVYSYDDRNWTHVENTEWIDSESTLRVRFTPSKSSFWIARIAPYTGKHLERLLGSIRSTPNVKEEVVGKTAEGRPMRLLTITDPAAPAAGKKVIWLMARQHSWETGTSWVADGALRFLVSGDPEAKRIRRTCIFKVFPMADPDGVSRGGVRFNKNGYDLNRNWDAVDTRLMPEIDAQRRAILKWVDSGQRIDLFLTMHNTESVDYIEGPLKAGGPAVDQLGQRLWKLLSDTTSFHAPGGPRNAAEATTAGMKGRMTIIQGLFHDRKIPAFLTEQMVDASPKLKRCPTVQDRLDFGRGLVLAMAAAVEAR